MTVGYLIRRLLGMLPTFLGITLLVFALTRFLPGGPIEVLLMTDAGGAEGLGGLRPIELPTEVRAALAQQFGLDRPWPIAYAEWLGALLTGDLGTSYKYNVPVSDLLASRLPISLCLGACGLAFAYGLCVPLGMAKAVRQGTRFDRTTSVGLLALDAVPGWALGAVLLLWLGSRGWVPLGGFRSPDWETLSFGARLLDLAHHLFLPVLATTVSSLAALTLLVRNSALENLGQDYVRTAVAKGAPLRRVIWRHVWPNSLVPLCAGIGRAIGGVLAGSYLIEKIFNIDGLGYLGYTSLIDHDYAVVMGVLTLHTGLGLLGNLLADLLTAWADPRIRFDR